MPTCPSISESRERDALRARHGITSRIRPTRARAVPRHRQQVSRLAHASTAETGLKLAFQINFRHRSR